MVDKQEEQFALSKCSFFLDQDFHRDCTSAESTLTQSDLT